MNRDCHPIEMFFAAGAYLLYLFGGAIAYTILGVAMILTSPIWVGKWIYKRLSAGTRE